MSILCLCKRLQIKDYFVRLRRAWQFILHTELPCWCFLYTTGTVVNKDHFLVNPDIFLHSVNSFVTKQQACTSFGTNCNMLVVHVWITSDALKKKDVILRYRCFGGSSFIVLVLSVSQTLIHYCRYCFNLLWQMNLQETKSICIKV